MSARLWFLPVALLLFIHTSLIANGVTPVLQGSMPDTDTYMWLVRIENYVNGQNWFDQTMWRMNTPYGMPQHWSHVLDMLIIGLAWPAHAIANIDWHTALFWAGALVPVLLHILFALALGWMVKPLMPKETLVLVMLYAAIQPVVLAYNLAGRPDHQTLLMIAGVGFIGLCIRAMDVAVSDKQRRMLALLAGVVAGVGLWVSSEFELTFVFVVAPLALFWLLTSDERALTTLTFMGPSLLGIVFGAVLFERGPEGLFVRELDKVSLSQVVAVACFAALWLGLYAIRGQLTSWPRRVLGACAVGTVVLCALALLAPEVLRGPSGDMDPRVVTGFAMKTSEMLPLWPVTFEKASLCALWAGPAILGVFLWCGLRIVQRTDKRWLILLAPAAAYLVVGMLHARFMQLATPLGAVLLVDAGITLKVYFESKSRSVIGLLTLLSLLIVPLFGALVLNQMATAQNEKEGETNSLMDCAVTDILPELQALPPSRLLTGLNYGPELLYRTAHSVVGGPYHRNRDGLVDVAFFFRGPALRAEEVVRRRQIDYVLICDESNPRELDNYTHDILKGDVPAWLQRMPLPETTKWQLFKVLPAQP